MPNGDAGRSTLSATVSGRGREVRLRGGNQLVRRFQDEFRFQEWSAVRRARHDRCCAPAAGIVNWRHSGSHHVARPVANCVRQCARDRVGSQAPDGRHKGRLAPVVRAVAVNTQQRFAAQDVLTRTSTNSSCGVSVCPLASTYRPRIRNGPCRFPSFSPPYQCQPSPGGAATTISCSPSPANSPIVFSKVMKCVAITRRTGMSGRISTCPNPDFLRIAQQGHFARRDPNGRRAAREVQRPVSTASTRTRRHRRRLAAPIARRRQTQTLDIR